MNSFVMKDAVMSEVDLLVVGLGYVGLPLAQEAARSGVSVLGFDTSRRTVDQLNAGKSHVDDLSDSDVQAMLDAGFTATSDPDSIARAGAVVICVPTPLLADSTPDLGAVESATRAIGNRLRAGQLIVLESTTYPGTTNDFVRPLLEEASGLTAGTDFYLAYSPERIDPGNPVYGLRNTPKVVGGYSEACTQAAIALYSTLVDQVVPTNGTREAEFTKLLENTYRHVNIALMNEMSIFCHELGIDLWAAIDAAKTKPFGYHAFYPGPGVGGHCIPIDPHYLSYAVRTLGYQFRLVELAQDISDRMPAYITTRAQSMLNDERLTVNGAKVVLLGVTYKANTADQRETPARPIATRLLAMGADLSFFDPYVDEFLVDGVSLPSQASIEAAVAGADLAILLQNHVGIIDAPVLAQAALILDTRGTLSTANAVRL